MTKIVEVTPSPLIPESRLEEEDGSLERTDEMDVTQEPEVDVDIEVDEDIEGAPLELEEDEISFPEGPLKENMAKSPDLSECADWIKPEILMEEIFVKKCVLKGKDDDFSFPTDYNVILAGPSNWQIPELSALKEQLNGMIVQLSKLPVDRWRCHRNRMDIGNSVMSYVTKFYNPEFCERSWAEMFEILCHFEVVPDKVFGKVTAIHQSEERRRAGDKVAFDTVHLCEAPGAFISAVNHFINNSYANLIEWNWLATSLNPYHESNYVSKTITDDRLIQRTMDKWTFLKDNTGNILSLENFKQLIKMKTIKLSRVYLVTADYARDLDGETEASHVQFVEILAAIKIVEKGGSFVMKMGTFFEASTICHLYLVSCLFGEVHLFKPATSEEGTSEVYLICLEFLGGEMVDGIFETRLTPNLEKYGRLLKEGRVLLPVELIPRIFIERIIESAGFFCGGQLKILRRNLSTFGCDPSVYTVMKRWRKEVAEEWIEWNQIKGLSSKQRLFGGNFKDWKIGELRNLDTKVARLLRLNGTEFQKLEACKLEVMLYDNWRGDSGPEYHFFQGIGDNEGEGQDIQLERSYGNVTTSRFCSGKLLGTREEVRELVRKYKSELEGFGNMASICSGHDGKRVKEAIGKGCNVEFYKNLEFLCFPHVTWEFVTKTDFQLEKDLIRKLFNGVKSMSKNRSMFLCRFPMLTRLQTGMIFSLANVFKKVVIFGDPGKNVVGILLHKFDGLSQKHVQNKFRGISDVLEMINEGDSSTSYLQLVAMDKLLDVMPAEFLVRYNTLIICQDLLRTINIAECTIGLDENGNRGAMLA